MIYVVTGGAGFIGSHIVRHLAEHGSRVRVLDNFDTGSRDVIRRIVRSYPAMVEVVDGDIRDSEACAAVCKGADFVLHHAAIASVPRSFANPAECADVNVLGTATVLEAARLSESVKRVVLASSCAVYGNGRRSRLDESARLDPLSPYASSKLSAELFARNYARQMSLSTVALRYFNVYGEGQNPNGAYAAAIPRFIDAGLRGDEVTIYGDGKQVRDFVSVDDVIAANMLACSAEPGRVSGETFNVGTGVATSVNDLLSVLSDLIRQTIRVRREPCRVGDIRRSVSRIDRAEEILGYKPETTLRSGLQRMLIHAWK